VGRARGYDRNEGNGNIDVSLWATIGTLYNSNEINGVHSEGGCDLVVAAVEATMATTKEGE